MNHSPSPPVEDSDKEVTSYQKGLALDELSNEWLDFVNGKRAVSKALHSEEFVLEAIRLWLILHERTLRKTRAYD